MKRLLGILAALFALLSASPVFAATQASDPLSATTTANAVPACGDNVVLQPSGGSMGIHNGHVYMPYQLWDQTVSSQINLDSTNISSISVTGPDFPTATDLTPDTDPLLWFNVTHTTGTYTFNITTASGGTPANCAFNNVSLSWTHQNILVATWSTQPPSTATVGSPFTIAPKFDFASTVASLVSTSSPLTGIEYVIKVTDSNNNPVSPSSVAISRGSTSLAYDNTNGYWVDNNGGTGYSLSTADTPSYSMTLKAAGAYTITVYAIQN